MTYRIHLTVAALALGLVAAASAASARGIPATIRRRAACTRSVTW